MSAKPLTGRYHRITGEVVSIPPHFPAPRAWAVLFGVSMLLVGLLIVSVAMVFIRGTGIWGNNIPVGWGFPISNYIWWLGIGHAGTLISAMLLLMQENWRNSLNRFAEAMTLFAVTCGGLYPIIHLGRPWYFYWMAPYPSTMGVWPQFRSPLTWDFFAVLTYLIVSICFWYIGLVPDLAAARDRTAKRRWQVFFGIFALGWRGSGRHWLRWRQAYTITAAIAVPLVVSVHSEISMLFAAGPIPGWNSTVFPPYFVLGAAFSGFAIVTMLAVMVRSLLGLQDLVTERHLDMLCRMMLATGLMTGFGYVAEVFTAAYAGGYELDTLMDRFAGPYAWSFWGAVFFNFVPLQLLWFRKVRVAAIPAFLIALSVAVGMWMERYMLLVSSLYRDWLESSVGLFHATFWDWALYAGFIGFFLAAFLLFVRFLPVISQFEIKEALEERAGG
ncbi:MAG: polysulfide reductase NrfD [Porphyrobacter sp.]|nr:polysulfide reductase NrfD [Porphyrobacter sp.]